MPLKFRTRFEVWYKFIPRTFLHFLEARRIKVIYQEIYDRCIIEIKCHEIYARKYIIDLQARKYMIDFICQGIDDRVYMPGNR